MTEWIAGPTATVKTKLGPVRLAFTGLSESGQAHVHVSTQAHHNDDLPALTFRRKEFLVSVHLYASGEGWTERDERGLHGAFISRRGDCGSRCNVSHADAPTIYDALVSACSEAVGAFVLEHGEVIGQARAAQVAQQLNRLEQEHETLSAQLAEIVSSIATLSDELVSLS